MAILAAERQDLIRKSRRHDSDSGSPEVQVSLLTRRIAELTEHLRDHRLDHSSRRGLVLMVGRRNRLLKYLARTDAEGYKSLIKRLGLRK
jgi:small subunit ribosomal protein S15